MSADPAVFAAQAQSGAHVIVVGNEKGGVGKSTIAIHLAVALMRMDKAVGVIDLDLRQTSLTRYLDNRLNWASARRLSLLTPIQGQLASSTQRSLDDVEAEEHESWASVLGQLSRDCDFIIVDCLGGDTHYSRLAHAAADTLITPINDSFVDFALLAGIDPETFEVGKPSVYSEMVWECRKQKALRERKSVDWLVMRNRVSNLESRNNQRVGQGLRALSERIGFRLAPGFSERVIYRELYPAGLTLLDLIGSGFPVAFNMSHVAARQELRKLLMVLGLPGLNGASISF